MTRAGAITAAGAIRAAPRMPMRTGSTAREITQRGSGRLESDQSVVGLHQRDDEHDDDADPDPDVQGHEAVPLLEPLRVADLLARELAARDVRLEERLVCL